MGSSLSKVNKTKKSEIIKYLKNYKSIDKIIDFVKEQGGIDYSQHLMNNLTEKAHSILEKFPKSDYKKSLVNLLNYTISRNI